MTTNGPMSTPKQAQDDPKTTKKAKPNHYTIRETNQDDPKTVLDPPGLLCLGHQADRQTGQTRQTRQTRQADQADQAGRPGSQTRQTRQAGQADQAGRPGRPGSQTDKQM